MKAMNTLLIGLGTLAVVGSGFAVVGVDPTGSGMRGDVVRGWYAVPTFDRLQSRSPDMMTGTTVENTTAAPVYLIRVDQ